MSANIRALERRLDALPGDSEKIGAIMAYLHEGGELNNPVISLRASNIEPSVDSTDGAILAFLVNKHHLNDQFSKHLLRAWVRQVPGSLSPDRLKCANHSAKPGEQCPKPASKACSGCRLVSYCSQECQKSHWATHKQDCKDRLGRSDWKPDWIVEGRTPAFVSSNFPDLSQVRYGNHRGLWGNVPAQDILKLDRNEGASNVASKSMALAFIASGDLRNVIRTVNELPEDYKGQLSILVNDLDPLVVCRNFIILFVLALLPDNLDPSDLALHIWYSVFVPQEAYLHLQTLLVNEGILSQAIDDIKITCGNSLISAEGILRTLIAHHQQQTRLSELSPARANNSLNTIMMAPERADYRDRYYAGLKPSHRVAFQEWRTFGLVHPFGAFNAHINAPNQWLFLSNGELSLGDSASPLAGWDLQEALKAGPAHGTTQDDLMGCLYFYVRDQLDEFTRRLNRFNIHISMTVLDAIELASSVQLGSVPGLDVRSFDRIEVSNVVDREYIGIQTVLRSWGPLLNKGNKHSAIIGLYMNWLMHVQGGECESQDAIRKAGKIMKEKYPDLLPSTPSWEPFGHDLASTIAVKVAHRICHENSTAFERFLRIEKTDDAAKKAGLRIRKSNTIVPHKFGCSLGSSWRTLPTLDTEELRYIWLVLSGCSHFERYVEWVRAI